MHENVDNFMPSAQILKRTDIYIISVVNQEIDVGEVHCFVRSEMLRIIAAEHHINRQHLSSNMNVLKIDILKIVCFTLYNRSLQQICLSTVANESSLKDAVCYLATKRQHRVKKLVLCFSTDQKNPHQTIIFHCLQS